MKVHRKESFKRVNQFEQFDDKLLFGFMPWMTTAEGNVLLG